MHTLPLEFFLNSVVIWVAIHILTDFFSQLKQEVDASHASTDEQPVAPDTDTCRKGSNVDYVAGLTDDALPMLVHRKVVYWKI